MEVAQPATFQFPHDDPKARTARTRTMEGLLEGPSNRPVPNHLLESKVYTKLGRNGSVEAEPPVLHFGGYEVGTCHHQVLKLINISPDVSTVHIIPPQSKHFTISYKKANRLVPGLAFTVHVQFIPDEWRYYYDCVRIHCKGDETLLVPLHAYPATDLQDFPSQVDLCAASLGQSAQRVLPLRCNCPVDFEFRIVCREPHKDFHITPTSGIIPGNGGVDVTVTFTPSSYGTARIVLELLTSEFNGKLQSCVFTGTCSPNPCAMKEESDRVPSKGSPKSPEKTPFRISRKKKHLQSLQQKASRVIEFQNLRFPLSLSNPHAVASVLNQQPGKLRLKDVREGLVCPGQRSRQEKETLFQQVVQQNVAEEEANQLRWQIHRGSDPVSLKQRQRITDERRSAEDQYQVMIGRPDLQREYNRQCALTSSQRVLRRAGHHLTAQPQFDLYLNELWANRNRALRRFQQAARKVLIRCRVNCRLGHLRNLLQRLRAERGADGTFASTEEETVHILPTNHILSRDFPPYPAEPEGSTPGGLCVVTPQPADVQLKVTLPFYHLKVPQHYKLMGYQPVGTQSGSFTYHSRRLARPLRSGAEDELVPIGISHPEVPATALSLRPEPSVIASLTLTPPEQLLNPPNFHPMHVFNPAPGLVAFKRPLPYSETDLEHHLCPLPKYPSHRDTMGITHRKFLNREEIIRGVMSWKKFPSVVLSVPLQTASNCRPRWCDPFSADLLPLEAPPTLSHLPEEDEANIVPREADEVQGRVSLTPEMLRAEFTLIQDGGHSDTDTREPRTEEQNLEAGASLAHRSRRHLSRGKLLTLNKKLILD